MIKALALLAGIGLSHAALAQTPANWVGSYKITWPSERGHMLEAKMVLTAAGAGTWQIYGSRGGGDRNPCVGREVPARVEEASEREARILLAFAEALPGCKNTTVQLKAGDNNTVTGTRGKSELTIEKH